MSVAAPLTPLGELSMRSAQSPALQDSPACDPKGWDLPVKASYLANAPIKISLGMGSLKEKVLEGEGRW